MGTSRLGNIIDPATNTIQLVEWQMNFLCSEARNRVGVCGRRSGKTTVACTIMYLAAVSNSDQEIWAVATTYNQAKKLYFKELRGMIPKVWIKAVNKTDLSIELINGSLITLKGANNPDSLLGSGLDLLIVDEFQSQDPELLDYLRPMLADRLGKLVIIGTARGFNHLYDEYKKGDPKNPEKLSNYESFLVTTETAGVVPEEEIENARNTMDEKMFAQEFCASFENMAGRVYHNFSPDEGGNVKSLSEDRRLPLWIGMDFNVDNMNAVICQMPIIRGEKYLHIIDEIQITRDADTPKMILEIKSRYPGRDIIICPDATGRNRGSNNASHTSTNHGLLKTAGWPLKFQHTGNPDIIDRTLLLNGLIKNSNGVRKFFVDPRCKQVIKYLTQRPWKDGVPLKDGKIDHAADCVDYVVWEGFSNIGTLFANKF